MDGLIQKPGSASNSDHVAFMASDGRQPVSMISRTQSAATPGYSARASLIAASSNAAEEPFAPLFAVALDALAGIAEDGIAPRQRLPCPRHQRQAEHLAATVRIRFARTRRGLPPRPIDSVILRCISAMSPP